MEKNNFNNFINSPTRDQTSSRGRSITLIDVVLHNNNCIIKSETNDFPYIDQS